MINVRILTLQSSTFLSSSTPLAFAYGVYISQLIQDTRICFVYDDFSKRSKLLTKKFMLNGYDGYCLTLSFRKLYGPYNDLLCDYKLSVANMLNDLFHIFSYPIYLISTKSAWQVWPVSRGCLLLCGPWSYLCNCRRSVLPYTQFCNCLLNYDYVLHVVNFVIFLFHNVSTFQIHIFVLFNPCTSLFWKSIIS
jgi:hypothetical protein